MSKSYAELIPKTVPAGQVKIGVTETADWTVAPDNAHEYQVRPYVPPSTPGYFLDDNGYWAAAYGTYCLAGLHNSKNYYLKADNSYVIYYDSTSGYWTIGSSFSNQGAITMDAGTMDPPTTGWMGPPGMSLSTTTCT